MPPTPGASDLVSCAGAPAVIAISSPASLTSVRPPRARTSSGLHLHRHAPDRPLDAQQRDLVDQVHATVGGATGCGDANTEAPSGVNCGSAASAEAPNADIERDHRRDGERMVRDRMSCVIERLLRRGGGEVQDESTRHRSSRPDAIALPRVVRYRFPNVRGGRITRDGAQQRDVAVSEP